MTSAVPEKIVNLLLDVRGCYVTSGPRVIVLRPDITFSNAGAEEPTPHCKHDEPETERAPFPADKTTEKQFESERQRHSPLSLHRCSLPRSLVIDLFFRCRPSAVAGFVIAVIVDAIKRVRVGGPSSHISEKVGEGSPSIADLDASASPVGIASRSRVVTALEHSGPNRIFRHSASVGLTAWPQAGSRCNPALLYHHGVTMLAPSLVVQFAESMSFDTSFTAIDGAEGRCEARGIQRVSEPAKADGMFIAQPMTEWPALVAVVYGACAFGSLFVHLEALLSGVMRTAVTAARPLLFYPKEPRYA